jgi:hypothetical protein
MADTEVQRSFTVEIKAGVDAESPEHALMIVALDLLRCAFTDDDGRALPLERLPSGFVGYVDFSVGAD